ncbi:MAG: D-alanine--D-alanine ligase [Kiritimatiellae bacterium]|nr:D-alanine--D-alanine ligase [Kiritimatiellia bacterium]
MSTNGIKKVAVLMGGVSNERTISLTSGENVAKALESLGKYEVIRVILDSEDLDGLPEDIDAAYIALHGGWGENGGVQAALDARKIPYTGPGAFASKLAMDKIKTKLILEMNGVPTANWSLASRGTLSSPLPLPVVVKPPCDGSSVGISKVSKPEDWSKALEEALAAQGGEGNILVEEYIPGREMTVGIIDGVALPVIEIVAKGGWYGWQEKYESDETRYPFILDEKNDEKTKALSDELQRIALKAAKALNCRGVVRVDFRVSPLGRPYVLELNTSPGFTAHSLVPKAGMKTGLTFAEVVDKILSCAKYDSQEDTCQR